MGLSFAFGGLDMPGLFTEPARFVISGVEGRNTLGAEVVVSRFPGRDGARFIDASLPSRTVTVNYALLGDGSLATARDLDQVLMGAVSGRTVRRLEFTDQPGRYYEAVLSSASRRRGGETWHQGQLVFTCPRPFLYGAEVNANVSGGQLDVETNYVVAPVWRVQLGSAAPDGFTLDVNGQVFEYTAPLASSTVVTIDAERCETRVGGQLRVLEVAGTYPVAAATNAVDLSVPGAVSVDYRARWA